MDDLVRPFLTAKRDPRTATTDAHARYFGTALNDHSLTPGANPLTGPTRFTDWLRRTASQA